LKSDGTNTSWASASGGAGEINAILNASGADGTTGWTGTSVVSGSSSPLNPIVTTAFSIANSAVAESSTSGGYYPFTMPSGLLNRKLKVEFTFTTPATDVWRVSVYQGSTRVPLSTDSSSVTTLPASVTGGKFTAYFDTDSNTSWTLSVTRTSGSTGACVITNVIVGPGIQPQGAVVSAPKTITPVVSNFGTISDTRGEYVRVGNIMRLSGKFASGTPAGSQASITIPDSLNIDTVYWESGQLQARGKWTSTGASGVSTYSSNRAGQFTLVSGTTSLAFSADNSDLNFWGASNASAIVAASGDIVSFEVDIPIAEWAGSGTVNLAQNDVEYAYNTSTSTTTSDTTSFGYGPQGALIQSITAGLSRRVRFQKPIQTGDMFFAQYSADRVVWTNAGGRANSTNIDLYRFDGTNGVGLAPNPVSGSTTDVDCDFGVYRTGTATTWAGAASFYWRLVKVSAGSAVGFGLVSETSSGLMPSTNVNLDNASATRLGLKQYLHGTTYNGGNAPTVTYNGGGGSVSSVPRAVFIPYQMQDGTWRLKFNMQVQFSSTSRTQASIAVAGITTKNVSNYFQGITGSQDTAAGYMAIAYTDVNSNIMYVLHATATTVGYRFAGDIELESKPTWAY
jgi:hypothetical protein